MDEIKQILYIGVIYYKIPYNISITIHNIANNNKSCINWLYCDVTYSQRSSTALHTSVHRIQRAQAHSLVVFASRRTHTETDLLRPDHYLFLCVYPTSTCSRIPPRPEMEFYKGAVSFEQTFAWKTGGHWYDLLFVACDRYFWLRSTTKKTWDCISLMIIIIRDFTLVFLINNKIIGFILK